MEYETSVKMCAVEGCHGFTLDGGELCRDCVNDEIDKLKGIRSIFPKKRDKLVDFVWDMLPAFGNDKTRKLSAFGVQSKQNLQEIIDIMRGGNNETFSD